MGQLGRGIVVGVDGSDGAAGALRWAVEEAAFHGTTVTAVMAWGFLDQHATILAERFDPSYGESDALRALQTFINDAVGEDAAAGVEARVVCELPAPALLQAAGAGELLVVGARGLGGFRSLLLGSVSLHCLRHTPVPIAIVRPTKRPTGARADRIIVGIDGSDTSQRALRWAMAEGGARRSDVLVVHAWQMPYVGYYPDEASMFEPALYEQASQDVLDRSLAAVGIGDADLAVIARSVCGGAAAEILELADDADLVVLGSRGLGTLKGALVGSVTTQVSLHAPCPIVVIPPET